MGRLLGRHLGQHAALPVGRLLRARPEGRLSGDQSPFTERAGRHDRALVGRHQSPRDLPYLDEPECTRASSRLCHTLYVTRIPHRLPAPQPTTAPTPEPTPAPPPTAAPTPTPAPPYAPTPRPAPTAGATPAPTHAATASPSANPAASHNSTTPQPSVKPGTSSN